MKQLNSYRNDENKWQKLTYLAATSQTKEGYDYNYDANSKDRYALLIELQYNLQKEDEDLVRYLFKQELLASETHSMGGASDSLILNAYLLATFRNPKDIILFYKAKRSNFDASFAIGNEFIFYALRDKTDYFVKKNFPEIYEDIKGLYPEHYNDNVIEDWWRHLSNDYPNQEKDENLYTLYQRSFYFNDYTLARNYLEQWNEQAPDSADKKSALKHAYIELKEDCKVIELLKEELEASDTYWDRTSCLQDLLNFYSKVGQAENALEVVKSIDWELQKFSDWKKSGLGPMTIEQIFKFSLLTDNAVFGIETFNIAYKWFGEIRDNISYVGLNIALNAANKYSLVKESNQLEKLILAEKRRLDNDYTSDNWFKSFIGHLFRKP